MRDSMKPLRLGIFAVIDGQITYNATPVPVYDEKIYTSESPDLYILLSTQQETPAGDQNDCMFIRDSFIDIEIIRRTGSEVSKDAIDDVSDQLYQLLLPSQGGAGFTVSGFQVSDPRLVTANSQNVTLSQTQSVLRKICKFAVTLI